MIKQKPIMFFGCLDTDMVAGYPTTTYNGEAIRDDAICELMNTATREIYKMYKMSGGLWYEYVIGETGYPTTEYQEWNGFPDTPVLTAEYPHQIIIIADDLYKLYASKQSIVYNWGEPGFLDTNPDTTEECKGYVLTGDAWLAGFSANIRLDYPGITVLKTNRDIININSGTITIARQL